MLVARGLLNCVTVLLAKCAVCSAPAASASGEGHVIASAHNDSYLRLSATDRQGWNETSAFYHPQPLPIKKAGCEVRYGAALLCNMA